MVGYDDENQNISVYDCGREEVQTVPFEDLRKAWEVEKTPLGGPNEFVEIDFADKLKNTCEIAELALRKKAMEMLEPPVSFIGIRGLRKAAKEFANWEKELSSEGYRNSLLNMLEFMGTVPKLPNLVMGFDAPEDESIRYQACREKMGNMLNSLGKTYRHRNWMDAGELFLESGKCFEGMAGLITNYLVKGENELQEIPALLLKIAGLEESAYKLCILNPDGF
jgi:hypothetical protein